MFRQSEAEQSRGAGEMGSMAGHGGEAEMAGDTLSLFVQQYPPPPPNPKCPTPANSPVLVELLARKQHMLLIETWREQTPIYLLPENIVK